MVTPIRLSAAKPEVAEPKPIAKATALNTAVFFIKTLLLEKEILLLIFYISNRGMLRTSIATESIITKSKLLICDQTHINENDYIAMFKFVISITVSLHFLQKNVSPRLD